MEKNGTDKEIRELVKVIKKANKLYREGKDSGLSDTSYDRLLEKLAKLDPENELLKDTGSEDVIQEDRKTTLPTPMASFEKVYVNDDKGNQLTPFLNLPSEKVCSFKYDGAALLLEYTNQRLTQAYTKGRGGVGQVALAHAMCIPNIPKTIPKLPKETHALIKVELVIKKSVFDKKYKEKYKNSRNLAAGLLNKKDPSEVIEMFEDIEAKAHSYINADLGPTAYKKSVQLLTLEAYGFSTVKWFWAKELKTVEDYKLKLEKAKEGDYLIDGVVIEIDCALERTKLGFHSNNNPKFAVAFKAQFDNEQVITKVTDIGWNVSKNGLIIPRVEYEPVELNGTTCVAASGFNYKYILDNKLGIGSKIKLQKGGDIIPDIMEVVTAGTPNIPVRCPNCNYQLTKTQTGVHLVCVNVDCSSQKIKKIISFVTTMGIENFGPALIERFVEATGKSDIMDILTTTKDEFVLAGIGEKMSEKIYNNIQKQMNSMDSLETLMHASGIFGASLGSRKLKLIVDKFKTRCLTDYLNIDDIISIKGFEDKTGYQYVDNQIAFQTWYKKLPFKLKINFKTPVSGKLSGKSYVFSGFRDKDLENKVEALGGKLSSSVSKTTTALILNQLNSGSSKEEKAKNLKILIQTKEQFIKAIEAL